MRNDNAPQDPDGELTGDAAAHDARADDDAWTDDDGPTDDGAATTGEASTVADRDGEPLPDFELPTTSNTDDHDGDDTINITEHEGPDLQAGNDLDTGAGGTGSR